MPNSTQIKILNIKAGFTTSLFIATENLYRMKTVLKTQTHLGALINFLLSNLFNDAISNIQFIFASKDRKTAFHDLEGTWKDFLSPILRYIRIEFLKGLMKTTRTSLRARPLDRSWILKQNANSYTSRRLVTYETTQGCTKQ